jgi:hypothetical protein
VHPVVFKHDSFLKLRTLSMYKSVSFSNRYVYPVEGSATVTTDPVSASRSNKGTSTPAVSINLISMKEVDRNVSLTMLLHRLEVMLLYQVWFTVPQARAIVEYLMSKKNASIDTLVQCLSVLYSHLLNRENLYELFENRSSSISSEPQRSIKKRDASSKKSPALDPYLQDHHPMFLEMVHRIGYLNLINFNNPGMSCLLCMHAGNKMVVEEYILCLLVFIHLFIHSFIHSFNLQWQPLIGGRYELDLSSWDDRVVLRLLVMSTHDKKRRAEDRFEVTYHMM